jgi:hypothetical protein
MAVRDLAAGAVATGATRLADPLPHASSQALHGDLPPMPQGDPAALAPIAGAAGHGRET